MHKQTANYLRNHFEKVETNAVEFKTETSERRFRARSYKCCQRSLSKYKSARMPVSLQTKRDPLFEFDWFEAAIPD